jgi:hypothetical protein
MPVLVDVKYALTEQVPVFAAVHDVYGVVLPEQALVCTVTASFPVEVSALAGIVSDAT